MEAGLTVLMAATRLLRDVPETALRDSSNATMGNVSWAVGNAMEAGLAALMEATNRKIHVETTAGD